MKSAQDERDLNRQLVLEHIAASNRGELRAAVQVFASDTRNFGHAVGRDRVLVVLEDVYSTFPDWKLEVVDITAEADNVVVRCRVSGTHRGVARLPVNGGMLVGVKPTGKHFEALNIHWYKLRDGKIVDHYAARDDIGMMVQLGLLTRRSA